MFYRCAQLIGGTQEVSEPLMTRSSSCQHKLYLLATNQDNNSVFGEIKVGECELSGGSLWEVYMWEIDL